MNFSRLKVIHVPKTSAEESPFKMRSSGDDRRESFFIDTCQRRLWIFHQSKGPKTDPYEAEIYEGEEAYCFLLSVTSGLESQVLAETDIFGQMKDAWKRFESEKSSVSKRLQCIMQSLFQDTKTIRTGFLQGLGGSSYGSLVRRLLQPNKHDSILIVGAGKLARSVAPYLAASELVLTNRTDSKLEEFYHDLSALHPEANIKIDTNEASSWSKITKAVICVPYDQSRDIARAKTFKKSSHGIQVIHLGINHKNQTSWQDTDIHTLGDIFKLQEDQSILRKKRISDARSACEDITRLRTMENPVSRLSERISVFRYA